MDSKLIKPDVEQFKKTVLDYYAQNKREMPWRKTTDPYKILVSEIMLQQTQVPRVIPKYQEFLKQFPTCRDLANAKLSEVLTVWSGLGYNRRAKFLWQATQAIETEYNGKFPKSSDELVRLSGVGKNTAGAILTYAFNKVSPFIETNIRTVYIHHFFSRQDEVADAEILPILIETTPIQNPREFNWALMDYGSYLKQTLGNNIKKSKHYTKQSKFEGSNRQIRGALIQLLTLGERDESEIRAVITDERLDDVLHDMQAEGFVIQKNSIYSLS